MKEHILHKYISIAALTAKYTAISAMPFYQTVCHTVSHLLVEMIQLTAQTSKSKLDIGQDKNIKGNTWTTVPALIVVINKKQNIK